MKILGSLPIIATCINLETWLNPTNYTTCINNLGLNPVDKIAQERTLLSPTNNAT